tara:strand:+ start:1033 stop:1485 length:453 start_codon:yes stop_codon:yes gene_type:complete
MALNDSKKVSEYDRRSGIGVYNNSTDVFKQVFVTEVYSAIDANALSLGIADLTKVASAGNYVQDKTLANSVWSRTGAVSTLDYDNDSYTADPSNPVTGKTWVCYNDTSPNKDIFKLVDMTLDNGVTAADTTQGFNLAVNVGGSGKVTTNA